MYMDEKPTYTIAKYDKLKGTECKCSCHLPVTVTVYHSSQGKASKDFSTFNVETPEITILSE